MKELVGLHQQTSLLLLVVTTTTVVHAVPTRIFSSTNNLIGSSGARNSNHALLPSIPVEEMELESLKGSRPEQSSAAFPAAISASKKSASEQQSGGSATVGATTASSAGSVTTTGKPIAYVKKPENEETPALSDNANSLKYGGENADIEEALANMAHIPPSKGPSLSVLSSLKNPGGGIIGIGSPLGGDSIIQQKRTRTPPNNGMGLLSRAGGINLAVDYTPQDIAEYIFWNGDERGVELAINDFIQDGLITPQVAIKFLEDVKMELGALRSRYSSTVNMGRNSGLDSSSGDGSGFRGTTAYSNKGWDVPFQGMSKRQSNNVALSNLLGSGNGYGSSFGSSEQGANSYYPATTGLRNLGRSMTTNKDSSMAAASLEDLDYEEIVEKLRQADTKMREYALEGIIYQLARELFSMGLQSSGNSVPTFTTFIENLAVNGNISKDLERAVLETLVQALVDAANERGLLIAKSEVRNNLSAKPTPDAQPILIKKKST